MWMKVVIVKIIVFLYDGSFDMILVGYNLVFYNKFIGEIILSKVCINWVVFEKYNYIKVECINVVEYELGYVLGIGYNNIDSVFVMNLVNWYYII